MVQFVSSSDWKHLHCCNLALKCGYLIFLKCLWLLNKVQTDITQLSFTVWKHSKFGYFSLSNAYSFALSYVDQRLATASFLQQWRFLISLFTRKGISSYSLQETCCPDSQRMGFLEPIYFQGFASLLPNTILKTHTSALCFYRC